jgi:hypothetical protein
MKWNDVFFNTFRAIREKTTAKVRKETDFILPSMPMVDACRADDFDFFRPLIDSGDLTAGQMLHAAQRYLLGKSRSGIPIFWMIDDMLQPQDGHIGSTWISSLLKKREPLLEHWTATHCLFGLHLLNPAYSSEDAPVSIVESETSAVILSELLPESVWMAYATTAHLTPDLLAPLDGRTVTIYPRTDPTMDTYMFFLDYAGIVRCCCPGVDIHIDSTLEDHATDSQKDRCIDILEFITDSATFHPE